MVGNLVLNLERDCFMRIVSWNLSILFVLYVRTYCTRYKVDLLNDKGTYSGLLFKTKVSATTLIPMTEIIEIAVAETIPANNTDGIPKIPTERMIHLWICANSTESRFWLFPNVTIDILSFDKQDLQWRLQEERGITPKSINSFRKIVVFSRLMIKFHINLHTIWLKTKIPLRVSYEISKHFPLYIHTIIAF